MSIGDSSTDVFRLNGQLVFHLHEIHAHLYHSLFGITSLYSFIYIYIYFLLHYIRDKSVATFLITKLFILFLIHTIITLSRYFFFLLLQSWTVDDDILIYKITCDFNFFH